MPTQYPNAVKGNAIAPLQTTWPRTPGARRRSWATAIAMSAATDPAPAALACAALALAVFERREIGVGRSPLALLLGREPSAEGSVEAAREPSAVR